VSLSDELIISLKIEPDEQGKYRAVLKTERQTVTTRYPRSTCQEAFEDLFEMFNIRELGRVPDRVIEFAPVPENVTLEWLAYQLIELRDEMRRSVGLLREDVERLLREMQELRWRQ
jgi:hypothetical protein